jgi:Na+/melibiose symporter-like transporter
MGAPTMDGMNDGTSQPMDALGAGSFGVAANVGLEGAFEGGGLVAPEFPPVVDEGNLAYEPKPLSVGKAFVYSSGGLGNGTFVALNNYIQYHFLLPLGAFLGPFFPIVYGLLDNQRSFEGAIIQPLIGAWSDRIWTRLGRRRIFIVRFLPLCIVFLSLTPYIPQLVGGEPIFGIDPRVLSLILVGVSIFLFSVTYNMSQDPYSALMADITPTRQRGLVNGIAQSVGFVGQVSILVIAAKAGLPFTVLYPLVGALLLVFFLPTILGIREPRKLPSANVHKRYKLRDYWQALRADRQLQFYFAVQFFLWFGINSIVIYIVPYAENVVRLSESDSFVLVVVLLVSIALTAWPLGALSSRLSLKGVFFLGLLAMTGATITAIFLKDPMSLYIILAVAGVGYAATQATGYPILTRLVYPEQMGIYTGLNTTVSSIAVPLSTVIAGALVGGISYDVLFIVVGASFALGLIPLVLLRMDRSVVVRARAAAAAQAAQAATSAA